MFRLIGRRLLALAIAYAVVLGPIMPLLAAMAASADASGLGEICGDNHPRSGGGGPIGHALACPMCLAHDCGVSGFAAPGANAALPAPASARSLRLAQADEVAPRLRRDGQGLARGPPQA
jgi:DUF2946 family protein